MSVVKEMLRYKINIASFWWEEVRTQFTVLVGCACAMQVIATERMAHCLMAHGGEIWPRQPAVLYCVRTRIHVQTYVWQYTKCPISPVVSPVVVGLEDLLETASDVVEDYCLKRLEGPLTTVLEEEEQTGAVGGDRPQASGGGSSSMVVVQRVLLVTV